MLWFVKLFYLIKAFIPRGLQLFLRRRLVRIQLRDCSSVWPINRSAAKIPEGWQGWPDNKQFAIVLTHDVEKVEGHKKVRQLAELDMKSGFCSSFNLIPERYKDDPELRAWLVKNGFEVGVHDLKHNGKLFSSLSTFEKSAVKINQYIKHWNAKGFRSGAMHHNLEWIGKLDISYDASTFDTDPFEPQADGVNTIFPFYFKPDGCKGDGFVELPYTLIQDFTLFVIMREKTNHIWKEKLDWIAANGGMALLIVHPDYLNMGTGQTGNEEYPAERYTDFLLYVKEKYAGRYWNALPYEIAEYIRKGKLHPKNDCQAVL